MSTTVSLMTFEQFEQLPDAPGKRELLDGELIVSPPPKREHSIAARRCEQALLKCFALEQVWIEAGFRIGGHYLQPDVAVVFPDQPSEGDYWSGAPAIAVEVRSRRNTDAEIERKVELYLLNDIRPGAEVWVVDSKRQSVVVYRARGREIAMQRQSGELALAHGAPATVNVQEFFTGPPA